MAGDNRIHGTFWAAGQTARRGTIQGNKKNMTQSNSLLSLSSESRVPAVLCSSRTPLSQRDFKKKNDGTSLKIGSDHLIPLSWNAGSQNCRQ